MMPESIRSRGMRDILPEEMERFRRIEAAFRDVCLGWGYQEVRTPTIEHLFLFTSAGTLSPQMLDRVYSFLDWDGWSGERVVLRPDSTIPTVRLFEENMADQDAAKLFYVQNVFRFEQGDASREDWQCGVELLGDTFPQGDVELVLMAAEITAALNVDTTVRLSHPGIVRTLMESAGLTGSEQSALYDRILDGDYAALDSVGEGRLSSPASSLLAVEGEGPAFIENLRALLTPSVAAVGAALDELAAISSVLHETGVPHTIAPLGVRDFEYYTGPVFTLSATGKRIGGGGRYDSLAGLIGGRRTPASGFALDIDALGFAITPPPPNTTSVTILCEEGSSLPEAMRLSRELRRSGLPIELIRQPRERERRVTVRGGAYELRWNGAPPRSFDGPGEVVAAIAEARSQDPS
jgi:histidyl-tRNA synthetase